MSQTPAIPSGQNGGHGKLAVDGPQRVLSVAAITALTAAILHKAGCAQETARRVAEHLAEANLSGVPSHGIMRMLQYVAQFEKGAMDPQGQPALTRNARGAWIIDAHRGIGIPAMTLAMNHGCKVAREQGISVTAIVNCGHTGRLGAYAQAGAEQGCLNLCIGGGGRKNWRQVAPHGGTKGLLPTNPYAFGIPGGDRGPVVLDFATAKIAGGWIYAAKSAGTLLPEGAVIDAAGQPTRNPDDYFNGGAILPSGGAKGYALAVVAELIGEAMLGSVTAEMNWLLICIDTALYGQSGQFQSVAEEILQELRSCPPAPGFEKVEIPGERERDRQALNRPRGIVLPEATWRQIVDLAEKLEVPVKTD